MENNKPTKTMSKQNTAIQSAIEKLQSQKKKNILTKNESIINLGLDKAISILHEFLAEEEKQIKEALEKGHYLGWHRMSKNNVDYFTETFNTKADTLSESVIKDDEKMTDLFQEVLELRNAIDNYSPTSIGAFADGFLAMKAISLSNIDDFLYKHKIDK